MNKVIELLQDKRRNTDLLYRDFNFTFCFRLFILMVLAGIFFDNPANSINFSLYSLKKAVRLNLRPPTIMLGGMILGPLWGAVIGGFIDLISFFIWHSDMDYMVGFTLLTMLRGFLAGYIFNFFFHAFKITSVITSIAVPHLLISAVFIPGLLNYYYNVPFINNMRIRLIIQLVTIPLFTLVFYYILKGMKKSKELKNLHTRLKELLKVDELTGLSNRRHFMDYLNKMVSLSKRRSQSLSLLMADVDNFKNINDTYGHHMGDEFLKAVGEVLKENTREEDLAARMGGDEFVILLPQTRLKEALKIAERIKDSVGEISILSEDNINTLSIGAAVLNNDDNSESLLKKADDALYKAKEKGRNRVESLQFKDAEKRQELKFT